MPRKKMVIKFMEDAKKRELTYKKRSKTLIKKTSQLNTLCGVEILAVIVKPETAGAGGKRVIKTWPEDRASVMALAKRFRDLSPAGIKEKLNIRTYLEGELGKEELKLVKVRQCMLDDVLTTWDRRLHDLSVDDHIALHRVLGETLERARRMMAELGSMDMDVVATSGGAVATAPALQHAPAFLDNGFDLNLSDAGSSTGSQDHCYYLPLDMLPQPVPVQSKYTGFQLHMHPPCSSFPMAASPGFSFTCADINIMNRLPAAWTARLYDDFAVQGPGHGFADGAALVNHQQFQSDSATLANHQQFQSDGSALANQQQFQSDDAALANHQQFQFASAAVANHQQFQSACAAVANHQQFQSFDVAMAYHQDFQSSSFDAAGTGAGAYDFDAARTGARTDDGSYGFAAGTGAGAYGFDAAGSGAGTVDGSYDFAARNRAGAYGFDVAGTGARYELEPHATGVWPMGTPNNPVDAAAYQLQNDTVLWPDNGMGQLGLGKQEGPSRLPRFDGWM